MEEKLSLKLFPWENGIKPYFVNPEGFEWYVDKDIQRWIDRETESLPKLNNVYAFLVKRDNDISRVLINNKQQIIYDTKGFEDMCFHIDALKLIRK